ncbi:hypothetical protein ACWCQ0_13660 [Streptomyces massasporeus]|uniref:Uncharacterized protein n=1 Tax=Streptomyces massasporeus TaxID=67324 RepID=A0ABW6LFS8_9ACTN
MIASVFGFIAQQSLFGPPVEVLQDGLRALPGMRGEDTDGSQLG